MISNHSLTFGALLLTAIGSTQAQIPPSENGTVDILLLHNGPAPTPMPTGEVVDVIGSKTTYRVVCAADVEDEDDMDPCRYIGGTIIADATKWEYKLHKSTQSIEIYDGTTTDSDHLTTGAFSCDIVSSTRASCTGMLTSSISTRGGLVATGSGEIFDTIPQITSNMHPVLMTAGVEKLSTSTATSRPTSSSTGAAAPLVTQPALLIGGAAAILGGAMML